MNIVKLKKPSKVAISRYFLFLTFLLHTAFSYAAPVAIISTSPASGATGASLSSPITVTLNQAINPSQVKFSAYFLTSTSTPSYVGGVVSYSNNVLTLKSTYNLAGNTKYYVDVANAVSTVGGTTLPKYSFQFTTKPNLAPIANSQVIPTLKNTPVAVKLSATDPENDTIYYIVTGGFRNGTVAGTVPNYTYTPNANFVGEDVLTFYARDSTRNVSNTVTVKVVVGSTSAPPPTPTNTAPVANAQSVSTVTSVASAIKIAATDKENNALTYLITSQPTRGTLTGTPPNMSYVSQSGYVGSDSFTFTAKDASLTSNTATVSIAVNAPTPVPINTAPVASSQLISAVTALASSVTLSAIDKENNPLIYTVISQPIRGTLTGTPPNLVYMSQAGYVGSDSFTFTARDAAFTSNTATISVTVRAATTPPPPPPPPPETSGKVSLLLQSPAIVDKYPVFSGVPFARGVLKSTSQLMVENGSGLEIPAQFEVLSKWVDGSIKSVLVVLAENISSLSQQYYLRYDQSTARNYTSSLQVSDLTSALQVNTGVIRFNISKTNFRLFDQVWIDQNGNKIFDADEQIVSNAGDIFFLNAQDGQEYTSSRFASPVVTIEEQGPVRVVIKARGKLQAANGQTMTDFIVRLYAYANSDKVQVDYTLVDSREETNVNVQKLTLPLSAKAWGLRLPLNMSSEKYAFGGEQGQVYAGNVTGNHYLYQSGKLNYIDGNMQNYTFAYSGVGSGLKAAGWMDVSDAGKGVTVAVRDFWQQFPGELAVDGNQMVISLHPARAAEVPDTTYPALSGVDKAYKRPNTLYFPREGGAKSHRLMFAFHAGTTQVDKAKAINDVFQSHSLLLSATAAWYTKSKVFGDLIPSGASSAGFDDYLINSYYLRGIQEVKDVGGVAVQYGWRDFGDRMRGGWETVSPEGVRIPSWYNDTHVGATNFLAQYIRTKDVRWFELGEGASRHFMDIDVSHSNRKGYWSDQGFGPGEIHASGHQSVDHSSRNGHTGHAHVSGLPEYYWLTGDKRALEVINEMGSWWANAVPVLFPTPVTAPHYAEAERDYGWPLYVLNRALEVTGDVKYHKAAALLTKHMIQWWQLPSNHLVNGTNMGANDWKQGTGFWAMYPRMINSYGTAGVYNGTSPWMAGALLTALIHFYENNLIYSSDIDNNLLKDMMLQTMNYVVKWGWNNEKGYFKYGESNDYDGGYTQLLYPMAYLYRLYAQGGLAHPEWYDTAPKWKEITSNYFNGWKVVKYRSTSASGFYGYEFIYPMDFFTIMETLP